MTDKIKSLRPKAYPGQQDDINKALEGIKSLMRLAGDDPEREGVVESPERYVRAFLELTSGYLEDPKDHLLKNFSIQDIDGDIPFYDEMVISAGIPFNSLCEHHHLPFTGHISVGYIPNPDSKRIVGLSKLARCVDGYARRLQVQERLTVEIEQAITSALNPLGVAVVVYGKHTCQCMRGVKKDGRMITSRLTGVFRENPEVRAEFLRLLEIGR